MHDISFLSIQQNLPRDCVCLLAVGCEEVLTQVPDTEHPKYMEDQGNKPLCFSFAFKGSFRNWFVPEREGFAIVEAMLRLDTLETGHIVIIFKDRENLLYIYS